MNYKTILIGLLAPCALFAEAVDVYFGTGGGSAKGIYHAVLDTEAGQLTEATLAAEVEAPGFLAFHPGRERLYAVARWQNQPSVVAYQIAADGSLNWLHSEVIPDGNAAHIGVHPSGEFLLTAQYGGGSVALFPLDADGGVQACSQLVEHTGASGVVLNRQNKPHPHWVGFSPDGRYAFVPDLGMDQVVVYAVRTNPASIEQIGALNAAPGSGPRHMRFSTDGNYIFLLNELNLSVSTFAYDAADGTGEWLSTCPTLSDAILAKQKANTASEILVHPNGKFVYAANRGHDSVTTFRIDPRTGGLSVTDVEAVRGAWPRNINLDATGRWLLAAGRHSNSVALLKVDADNGTLSFPRGRIISVPSPTCVLLND